MKILSANDALNFLSMVDDPAGELMQRLMHVIYDLDREAFELFVQILLAKNGTPASQCIINTGYTGFSDGAGLIARAYALFTPDDFMKIASFIDDTAMVGEIRVYYQDGYVPTRREINSFEQKGVSALFANPQQMAKSAFDYDLIPWVAEAGKNSDERFALRNAMYGAPAQHSMHECLTLLIQEMSEEDFAKTVEAIFVNNGWAGKALQTNIGGVYVGTDMEGKPVCFCAKSQPNANDFENFYEVYLENQKQHKNLRAYLCHQGKADPEYEVREAQRDPENEFKECDIAALSPPLLVAHCKSTAWLRRWVVQRCGYENTEIPEAKRKSLA